MVVMCTCGGVDGGDLYYTWCVGSHPLREVTPG